MQPSRRQAPKVQYPQQQQENNANQTKNLIIFRPEPNYGGTVRRQLWKSLSVSNCVLAGVK